MIAAVSERHRLLLAGSGLVLVALLCIVQPWRYVDAFVYPPHAKMLLLSFGVMPSGAAVTIWILLNLFCLFRAGELLRLQRDPALLAFVAPAMLVMVATGYPGGIVALMGTIVLTSGAGRSAVAGLCLALLTVHPPLALLVTVLLLSRGNWHVPAVAAAWTMTLFVVSGITLGFDAWSDYFAFASAQPLGPAGIS